MQMTRSLFRRILSAGAVVAVLAAPAAEAMEGAQFRDLIDQAKTDSGTQALLDIYLESLVEGMNTVNFATAPTGRTGVAYCPPSSFPLRKENARDLILRSPSYIDGSADKTPVSLVLLIALRRTFPCRP